MNDKTHFGFKSVDSDQKEALVADVFHSVAAKYDLMNDLMSLGIHRLWKRFTIECSGARPGQKILDLAGGTGDLTARFSRIVGEQGEVVLADINDSMIKVGRDKLRDKGLVGNIRYVQGNAEALPFPDNYFDLVTIGFGLRNVTDKQKARLSALWAIDEAVPLEVTWLTYQDIIDAYRHPDADVGKKLLTSVIDRIKTAVPAGLEELAQLGRTLEKRRDDILAWFDHPGSSNGPTEAINGRLEHLRGIALGFRNLVNYRLRSLLEAGGFRPLIHSLS